MKFAVIMWRSSTMASKWCAGNVPYIYRCTAGNNKRDCYCWLDNVKPMKYAMPDQGFYPFVCVAKPSYLQVIYQLVGDTFFVLTFQMALKHPLTTFVNEKLSLKGMICCACLMFKHQRVFTYPD